MENQAPFQHSVSKDWLMPWGKAYDKLSWEREGMRENEREREREREC